MLKKFLKFLKGTSREQEFDGSYLDHLLAQVRPQVEPQLEQCPEHDPLLLVVAEILRLTKPDQWEGEIECPLCDEQSPALGAPPPPSDKSSESSEGFEIVETSEAIEEGEEGEEDEEARNESSETEQAADYDKDESSDQDEAPDQHEPQESADGEEHLAAADGVHVEADGLVGDAEARSSTESDLPEEPASLADGPQVDPEKELDDFDTRVAEARRLDSPEVLQAGRIFLGLLIENDRLPVDMQLSIAETMLARDLLLGYFVHDDQFEQKAKELLSLVEQKFNEGAFSQARILLQLFQTDRPTRINNDRNLFYEDMILRLGIRRRNLIDQSLLSELSEQSKASDLDVGLTHTAAWLEANLHIKFHLFTREPDTVDRWRELAQTSRRTGADDVFLRYIPPKRWRPLHACTQPPTERMLAHVSAATIKRYIVRQLKTCYFVLRAVGDTGLESFLDVYFNWTEEKFGFNSVRLMPLVYRHTMADTQLIDKIFEDAFRRFFQKEAATFLQAFDDDAILAATRQTLDALAGMDFNQIPPGDYDLGGLVLDRLFELEYHQPEFAFKLHRLT